MENLREASNYEAAQIWLFSVELFHKEMLRFSMKIAAENAETKAAYDYQEQLNKTK